MNWGSFEYMKFESYRGYELSWDGDEYFVYSADSLVGSAKTYLKAVALVNSLITQRAAHESQLI